MVDTTKHPLPDGIADAVVNRAQLAEALAVSEPTIDRYRKDGMPVMQEGTNGQAYQFVLSECWAWVQERTADRKAHDARAQESVQQLRLQVLGGSLGESEMALTPKERGEIYAAEVNYTRLATERGQLIPRAEVTELLDHVLATVRSSVMGLPDRLSRDAGLTGRQAEQAVAVTDDLVAEIHRTLGSYVERMQARQAQSSRVVEAAE
jgi:phage terminase Nu1 subunit (DNA packaging protein)